MNSYDIQQMSTIQNRIESMYKNLLKNYNAEIYDKDTYTVLLKKIKILSDEMLLIRNYDMAPDKTPSESITKIKINNLSKKVLVLSMEVGFLDILDLFRSNYRAWYDDKLYIRLPNIDFYNTHFNIMSYRILKKDQLKDNSKEIKEYWDMKNSHCPMFVKVDYGFRYKKTIFERINSCEIAVNIMYYDNDTLVPTDDVVCIYGYFENDNLNIAKKTLINDKYLLLRRDIIDLSRDDKICKFKLNYLDNMSVKDLIILQHDKISEEINHEYIDYLLMKAKNTAIIVKEFMCGSIVQQRKLLVQLLCSDLDDDLILANLLYESISKTTEITKATQTSDDIYNTLHYNLQEKLKVALKTYENTKKRILDDEGQLPYEKRIITMNVTDSVKKKAITKLKEMEGGRESSSKAQNYLDGLLKIPFGKHKREPIFCYRERYILELESAISNIKEKQKRLTKTNICYTTATSNIIEMLLAKYQLFTKTTKVDSDIEDFINHCVLSIGNIRRCTDELNSIKISLKNIFLKQDNDVMVENVSSVNDNPVRRNNRDINMSIGADIDEHPEPETKNKNTRAKSIYSRYNYSRHKHDSRNNDTGNDSCNEKTENDTRELIKDINVLNDVYNIINDIINKWQIFIEQKTKYLDEIDNVLNEAVHGHKETKRDMKRLIGQWLNGKIEGNVIGLCGPPGVGKTSFAKRGLSKCLKDDEGKPRPFAFLPIGGATNGSFLEGHGYTYLGSTWGKIVDILMETDCLNPIIFIDELDKISNTEHGKEIIGILTHITDPTQNNDYQDKFFQGIPLDLSKALFVFSYNDRSLIDRILRDRIHEIQIKALSEEEKIYITLNYTLPELYKNIGFSHYDITITEKEVEYLINTYTYEAGIRKLNELLNEILREINLERIKNPAVLPKTITIEFIEELFNEKHKTRPQHIHLSPRVGMINGLHASATGLGGLTAIEVVKCYSESRLSLELTGSQGDVMKESMKVAKSLVWNLIPDKVKKQIKDEMDNISPFGLHIHCPDGATPKDGPSAGGAITVAIISRLCNLRVRNDICMTGEINLNGNFTAIGGLDAKLKGGERAGCTMAIIPKENQQDYDNILKEYDLKMDVKIVDNIHDVLKYALVKEDVDKNDIVFNTFY